MQHKLSKRLLLIPLLLAFLCSAAFAVSALPAKKALADDNRQTYAISNRFTVYADVWQNEIETIDDTSTEVILRSPVMTTEAGDVFDMGDAGFSWNSNGDGSGLNLDGLEINFYANLSRRSGSQYLRVYFDNNAGWYNASDAGFSFYVCNVAEGKADLMVFKKIGLNDNNIEVGTINDIPFNNDYNYWTDGKVAGEAPATGTLNTWKFYFGKGVETENDVYGHLYGVFNGTVVDFYNYIQVSHPEKNDQTGDTFSHFDNFELGEGVAPVFWYMNDGGTDSADYGMAMRITSITSPADEAAQMVPYGYKDESDDGSLMAGYTGLGYPYFSTGLLNNYSVKVRNTAEGSLGNAVTTFSMNADNDAMPLNVSNFTQSFKAADGAEFSFVFNKKGLKKALLTVTSDGTEVASDVEVPFSWNGFKANRHDYSVFSISEVAGSYSVTLSSVAQANVDINASIPGLSDAIADFISAHGNTQIGFAMDTQNPTTDCKLVIKSVVSEPAETMDSYPGYDVVLGESMVISESADGHPVFYNAEAEQYLVSNTETLVTPDSFSVDLSLVKNDTTEYPFLIGVASKAQASTWVAVQITYVNETQAKLALALVEGENVTLIGESEAVDFAWDAGTYNYIAVITVNGETTVMLNFDEVIEAGYSEELETFKDTYFAEPATLDFVSMGDARTQFSVAGISELVEMADAAPGWSPGARNENATFVYGTDGAVGVMHNDYNSQMYNAPIAPENLRLSVYSRSYTAGTVILGLQNNPSNAAWFSTTSGSGVIFTFNRDVKEQTEDGGSVISQSKVSLDVTYYPYGVTTNKALLSRTVVDWTDGEIVNIYLQKAEDGSWMLMFNGTDLLAGLDETAKANFNDGMNAFVTELTDNSAYFLSYSGGTPTDFVLYYKSLCVGTPSISGAPGLMAVGDTAQLNLQISPAMGAVTGGSWSSSDAGVVSVDENGLITAVADGTATITFTTTDGVEAKITVTVGSAPQSAVINGAPETLAVGEYVQLTSTVTPAEAAQTGTWTSSDDAIATVDSTGRVTAVAAGTVTITFTTTDGNVTASVDIEITDGTTGNSCNGCGGTAGTGVAGLSVLLLAAAALIAVRKVKN